MFGDVLKGDLLCMVLMFDLKPCLSISSLTEQMLGKAWPWCWVCDTLVVTVPSYCGHTRQQRRDSVPPMNPQTALWGCGTHRKVYTQH